MTTTKTITISLADSTKDETVTAEYFQIEDGWVTFKSEEHKAVAAYPEKRVTRIKSDSEDIPAAHQRRSLPGLTSARAVEEAILSGHHPSAKLQNAARMASKA